MNLGTTLLSLLPLAGLAAIVTLTTWQMASARRGPQGRGGAGDAGPRHAAPASCGNGASRARDAAPSWGTVAWACFFAALLMVATVLRAAGIYDGSSESIAIFSLVATASGLAVLQRDRIERWYCRRLSDAALHGCVLAARGFILVLVVSTLAYYVLETPWNPDPSLIDPISRSWEQSMICCAMLALWLLFRRRSWGCNVLLAALAVSGIAQYFVTTFKGSAIMPGDLLALGTAAAVGNSLRFQVGDSVMGALTLACVGHALLAFVVPARVWEKGMRVTAESERALGDWERAGVGLRAGLRAGITARNLPRIAGAALCMGLAVVFGTAAYGSSLAASEHLAEMNVKFWEPNQAYRENGFLTSFVSIAHDMPIRKPAGYTEDAALELEAVWASRAEEDEGPWQSYQLSATQFSEVLPSVVCVMNETFADLRVLGDFGYEGPRFFSSMDDCLSRGALYVSVLGGGTCNTEFEFLTGDSMAFGGQGKYPYNLYDLSGVGALAGQMRELGYATTAIHPNLASNWKRDKVYQQFGFDRFLDIQAFEGAPTFHSGVTDAATYDKILEVLEQDGPQFVFDVTMQNHTGYDQFNIPGEALTHYAIEGQSEYDNAQLNEYLTCIEESDRALEEFVGRLRGLDKPVILLFFGDHQPNISQWELERVSPGKENDVAHVMRAYQSVYMTWANYNVAGSAQASEAKDTSVNYLGALFAQEAGIPLTTCQKSAVGMAKRLPAITLVGSLDPSGTWHDSKDASSPIADVVGELAYINYLEFGSRV